MPKECTFRVLNRYDHPTLRPHDALHVLERFAASFQTPHPYEGFDRMLALSPQSGLSQIPSRAHGPRDLYYSPDEIDAILGRILGPEGDPSNSLHI
ncbi:uncharacterized protein EI90DRAFT_3126751 [Cantharellus anzutake]|uniref:uncharacterized protein n=1 Tax=Cantharellus anzutake TaxID=1750568 RepID=UPI0019066593|nr:uncharacterized protein EI90DRAFT_3126751 [Cantharellus anzutake]KAF8327737.1 hypothetical protein EI90DRAFT_3126751 [Cantharellus anzutake]